MKILLVVIAAILSFSIFSCTSQQIVSTPKIVPDEVMEKYDPRDPKKLAVAIELVQEKTRRNDFGDPRITMISGTNKTWDILSCVKYVYKDGSGICVIDISLYYLANLSCSDSTKIISLAEKFLKDHQEVDYIQIVNPWPENKLKIFFSLKDSRFPFYVWLDPDFGHTKGDIRIAMVGGCSYAGYLIAGKTVGETILLLRDLNEAVYESVEIKIGERIVRGIQRIGVEEIILLGNDGSNIFFQNDNYHLGFGWDQDDKIVKDERKSGRFSVFNDRTKKGKVVWLIEKEDSLSCQGYEIAREF